MIFSGHPLIIDLRHYEGFGEVNRFNGNVTIGTTTVKFWYWRALENAAALGNHGHVDPSAASRRNFGRWMAMVGFCNPVEQIIVDAPEHYTLRLGADGRLTLRADYNRGTATYTLSEDRHLAIGPAALTRAMCPPVSLGDRFVAELTRAMSFFLREGDLFLERPIDSARFNFAGRTRMWAVNWILAEWAGTWLPATAKMLSDGPSAKPWMA
jgi:heat shock protein HslJ